MTFEEINVAMDNIKAKLVDLFSDQEKTIGTGDDAIDNIQKVLNADQRVSYIKNESHRIRPQYLLENLDTNQKNDLLVNNNPIINHNRFDVPSSTNSVIINFLTPPNYLDARSIIDYKIQRTFGNNFVDDLNNFYLKSPTGFQAGSFGRLFFRFGDDLKILNDLTGKSYTSPDQLRINIKYYISTVEALNGGKTYDVPKNSLSSEYDVSVSGIQFDYYIIRIDVTLEEKSSGEALSRFLPELIYLQKTTYPYQIRSCYDNKYGGNQTISNMLNYNQISQDYARELFGISNPHRNLLLYPDVSGMEHIDYFHSFGGSQGMFNNLLGFIARKIDNIINSRGGSSVIGGGLPLNIKDLKMNILQNKGSGLGNIYYSSLFEYNGLNVGESSGNFGNSPYVRNINEGLVQLLFFK